ARHLAADETTTDFRNDMLDEGPGGYFISVQGIGDYENYEDGSTYESSIITLLESPENLYWDGKVAHWSSVANAEEYQVKLYRDGMVELETGRTVTAANIAAGMDYTAEIEAGIGGVYTFRVFAKSSNSRVADSGEAESGGIVKLSQTAYMALELTSPTGTGNTIGVGGSVKTGTINLVNGTASVELKGTKTAAQSVTIGGMNKGSVTIGGDVTAPTFTIDTADISAGGNKAFTLTVSEEGYSDVVYNITVAVAAEQPEFTKDGVVSWEDTAYETGYSLQLYMDDSKYGDAIIVDPDTISYDFSKIMDDISKLEDGYGDSTTHNIKVAVTALGDGESYMDGPTVESNVVEQLATLELAYFEPSGTDKGKLVLTRPSDYKYEIELYKAEESAPNVRKLVATKDAYGTGNRNAVKIDFYMEMKKNGDGMYYAGIKAVNNYSSNIQRASLICKPAGESDGGYKCETTADLGLTLNTPNPDANNFITDFGKGVIMVDVASGTQSVILLGAKTSEQELVASGDTGKLTYPIVSDEVVTLKLDTSSLFNNRLALTVTVTEAGKIGRTYEITVIVAPPAIESLVVTSADDDNSDDKTVIKASGTATAENERVYKNFGKGEAVLPVFDEVVGDGWTAFPGDGIITAANGDGIAVVERRIGTNKAKKAGKTIAVVEAEADVTAPSFVSGPTAQNIGTTELTLFAKLDEAGTVYYAVYADGETAPTAAELKSIGNTYDTEEATNEASIPISGLQPGTAYDIYVIAEDKKGNLQADVRLVEINTLE
ncbi:MAG TPA: fibronectin type III domain-containing protein, partial [Clostridia bacterium]|nr:fibronectin type III domain-containing protein [Clostridia bacterium]